MDKLTILNKITNTPLLASPELANTLFTYVTKRNGIDLVNTDGQEVGTISKMFSRRSRSRQSKPYYVQDGIAYVSIEGSLAHRYGYLDTHSGVTGYDGIQHKMDFAAQDADVKGVFLDICSGGGEVTGCFELCEYIANFDKPTFGYADGYAYSAAYAILSSCDQVATSFNGGLGSIGVVIAHMEVSKEMEEKGRKITLIHSGQTKVEGNPYQELEEAVVSKWQARIDELRDSFCSMVANKRTISKEAALSTEADTFEGAKALDLGLCDFLMTKNESFSHFLKTLSNESTTNEGSIMNANTDVLESAEEEAVEAQAETVSEEAQAETQSSSDRMNEVASCENFGGNEKLAMFLLANSDMSSDKINEALALVESKVPEMEFEGAGVEADAEQAEEIAEVKQQSMQ